MEFWSTGVPNTPPLHYSNHPLHLVEEETSMTSQEFVNQLKKDIQAFPKIRIKHPFLKAVCAGTATMDQIRAWAIQDYQFRAAVPRIVMLRYLACTDPEIARKLWGVVAEEIAERYITSAQLQELTRTHTFRRMELLYDIWSIDGF